MSPVVITALVVAGIVVLFIIGYVNHMVENSKLEKARLKADFNDRMRRSRDVSESMPGQLMTPALKLLLSRFELQFGERLLQLDKQNANLKSRLAELRELVAKNDAIPVGNPPQQILTEAKAKDVRFLLENLHGQITRAAQEHLIPAAEGKQWLGEIRHMLVQLHFEFFRNCGQQYMQKGQPGQARLFFERGVQYLRKQGDLPRYKTQLKQLEDQLARANAVVLEKTVPEADEVNELTEGLKGLEEDDWKKKNIYD
ncbi:MULTISPECIES: hypothetical protein [Pseudomonas]|uniref:hypothetical protein n=1 Tax=Pseudomonas TaxID=286 RepID=UPI001C801F52|nr:MULTISPECIES: hypothetical protein [Pseudomonas]MDG9926912.1 hypothetical protein [Pseudomonas sp. GD04042]MDH0484637.1 hypothetical protein [Pseudomonas sp. GD04015]MDH0602328.1 hypothetical protein [Pseudomonas sp. GD03869]MDH0894033.1 hypothetical protein [Pseudomonas sp. GD03875]MDH1062788.1 hypothetical protein [Pseudomonas sp. GD03985]